MHYIVTNRLCFSSGQVCVCRSRQFHKTYKLKVNLKCIFCNDSVSISINPLFPWRHAGGPLSVNKELAQLYNLEGVKEVNVRKVDKEEVGIDLLELKFKVQNLHLK